MNEEQVKSNHQKNAEKIKKLEALTHSMSGKMGNYRDSAFQRFPFLFVFLSTFGLVATLYGFEKVIDKISFFSENPEILLTTGIVILLVTGTLYKKLD